MRPQLEEDHVRGGLVMESHIPVEQPRHAHHGGDVHCTEIAPNVCLRPVVHSNAPKGVVLNTPEADAYGDHLSGFIIAHDRNWPQPWRCEGAVNIDRCGAFEERNRWDMTGTLEGGDLTLSPSILCVLGAGPPDQGTCGFHGYVRDGRWVPA